MSVRATIKAHRSARRARNDSRCAQGMHEIVSWPQPGAIVRCKNCDAALTVGRVYPRLLR